MEASGAEGGGLCSGGVRRRGGGGWGLCGGGVRRTWGGGCVVEGQAHVGGGGCVVEGQAHVGGGGGAGGDGWSSRGRRHGAPSRALSST